MAVAEADILGDIDGWVTIAQGKGQTPTVAVTSKKVFSLIQRNAAVQKAIFGVNGAGHPAQPGAGEQPARAAVQRPHADR